MEPTDWGLLAPLCLLAAAAFGATVLLWSRVSGGGARQVAARSGLLVATQALLTAALVMVANKYFVFYATWNDLLGSDRARVQVKQVQTDKGKEAVPSGLVHRTTTALGPHRKGRKADPAKDGRVDRLQVTGARSGLDGEAHVYLPPEYFQPKYAAKRLPVVLLLSGRARPQDASADEKLAWIKQARLPQAAQALARGDAHAQPMIYVMTRSAGALTQTRQPPAGPGADKGLAKHPATAAAGGGHPASCLNVPGWGFGQAETFFTQDLPVAVGDTYRVPRIRAGWAVAGFGASGQCAARFAMLRSDLFAAGASLNGAFDPPPAQVSGGGAKADLYGGSKALKQDNDLLWRLEHLPPPPVSVLVAAGQDSGHADRQATRFAALAKPPMRAEKIALPGAAASLRESRAWLPQVLAWLGRQVRPE
ncbi:alpha/beta hydrolase [Spirillospora sp. NPDC050679]